MPSASVAPHDCGILSVDPAITSGWAIWSRGMLIEYGECDVLSGEPERIVARLVELVPGPHVLVVERPFYVKFCNQTSIGAADKIWRELGRRARLARRIVRVYPSSWRARVLGKGWGRAERDKVRAREMEVALNYCAMDHLPWDRAPGPDAAAAILIGRWASHAGEVALALAPKPKPKKRAA